MTFVFSEKLLSSEKTLHIYLLREESEFPLDRLKI